MTRAVLASQSCLAAPRAQGTLRLSSKLTQQGSAIDGFRTSGSSKVAFPRRTDAVEAIVLNTSGGLTGGDTFDTEARAGAGSHLILTTQAAERGYRSQSGVASVATRLIVEAGAVLHWLPQELILFEGTAIKRSLSVDLHGDARFVMVEPLVFGRRAMGETVTQASFRDQVMIRRDDQPIYCDRIHFEGNANQQLARPAVAKGATAMASVVFCGPQAETMHDRIADGLSEQCGTSLIAPDVLILRAVAEDSFLLRRTLVPILEALTNATLPKSWSL